MEKIYTNANKGNKWYRTTPLPFFRKLFYLKLMFLTLLSVQMKAQGTSDQSFTTGTGSTVYNNTTLFQTFKSGFSGELKKVRIKANTDYTGPANNVGVQILSTDSNGVPTSTILATSINSLPASGWIDCIFLFPATVTAGTTYTISIYFSADDFTVAHNNITTEPSYANGKSFYQNGSTGFVVTPLDPNLDFLFETFVEVVYDDNETITHYTGCSGITDGSITLAPVGGIAPFTYAWSSTVSGFTNPGNASSATNLLPGAYTCVVTDASNPVQTKTFNYTILDQGPVYDAFVTNNATCGTYGLTINPLASTIYQNSFDTSTGITLSGDAVRETSNQIKLVPDQNSKNGKVIINNLPATLPSDFEVNWRFFHLQKDGADGYSFNLGNDSFPGAAEDGTNQGLAVKFKIYQQDQVSIKWNGAEIVAPVNTTLELGRWQDAKLTVVAGKVTLYVNGKLIANEVTIPSYAQNNAYKIIFAARTGGASNESIIDDVTFGDLSAFEYSIDGTTFQTSNVFSNITLPTDRTLPIWLKQNGCARKIRDYVYPLVEPTNVLLTPRASTCNPTSIEVNGAGSQVFNAQFYTNNFSTKNGYAIGGSTKYTANGILLTQNESDNKGYLLINKPEAFEKKSFTIDVSHKALALNGADGFSINLGNASPIVNNTVDYDNGVTSGLAVRFKTFGTDRMEVFYNNTQLTMASQPSISIESGNTETYRIRVVNNTTLNIFQGSDLKFAATLPAAYATDDFSNHQFVIAARTGGSSNENLISNVSIYNGQLLQASLDNSTFTDIPTTGSIALPLTPAQIINNKVNVYFKVKDGCSFAMPKEVTAFKSAAAPTGTATQMYTEGTTKFEDLTMTTVPGYVLRWYTTAAGASSGSFATGLAPTALIPNGSTTVYAVAFPTFSTTCRSASTEVTLTAVTPSSIVLTQIGNEGDDPNTVTSVVTVAQLGQISPAITGIEAANESAYQAYIDANPALFSAPATAAEVQDMVTAVNAQVASNTVLTQIGNEGDEPNTVTSVVTVAQLGQILPAITGVVAANESAYQAYIDANPNLFASPATAAEVQAMVNAVNTNVILTQIGNEGDSPNTVPSVITDSQLLQIIPAITGVTEMNVPAYQAYIDANPALFDSPATAAQVQAMVNIVNGQVAASNAVLTQIGNEGDEANTVPSVVTVAQLGQISPAITGVVAANETAYRAYIDANPALFSAPATAAQVQAMVTAVNTPSAPSAPTATATQVFCTSETVAALTATGTDLKWYDFPFGGSALATTVVLTAKTYYVSQTVNGIESARTPVTVLLKAAPDLTATNIAATSTSCNVGSFSFDFTRNISRDIITEAFDFTADSWTIHKDAIYEMGDGMGGGSQVKLTANIANKNGQLLFAKTSRYPKAFELQFKAFMLSKAGGNGFSVNYGEISNIESLNENGNSTGLVVRFITAGTDKVQIFYDNVQVGTDYTFTLEDGTWDDFSLFVDKDGKITLRHDISDVIFQDVQLPTTYTTTPNYQWAFAGRTGASFNEHIIDQVVFLDNSGYEFSYDNTNWQTSTSFTNVPSGTHTIYARYDYNTCSASLTSGTVVVPGAPVTPTFAQVAPVCKDATVAALPTSSTNTTAITGTWAPAINNAATTTYTFTPAVGQCANTTTMEIVVNDCSVISGKVYEDANASTIDGTLLTVGGTYLSIYEVGTSSNTFKAAVPVASGTGVYSFPALPYAKYKIVIGTSADGSETPSYPNVGTFSMTASAEGEAGTAGDGTPNGITFVTTSAGATVYSGSRVRADAGVDFAIKQLAPLPVRLISFTGKNTENGNLLNWETSSEVNFSHFEVERSSDAKKFEKIGKVEGNYGETYEFVDQKLQITNLSTFYRLKMVDLDGTSAFSKIIALNAQNKENAIGEIYPNPSNDMAKINITTNESGYWTINTFDITGKRINIETINLQKGLNQVELKKLGSGMNYIQISNSKTTEVRKVLKQ